MKARRSAQMAKLALVTVSFVLVGCSRAGASPAISDAVLSAAPAEPSATVVPSIEPSATVVPSIKPSVGGPPSASPVAEPPMAEPPAASIIVEGGDPVVGQLGTFTWENSGSDAPWLDGSPIHVGAGEQLTLTLARPVDIGEWRVSRVTPGNRNGIGAVGMNEGSRGPIKFQAPPPGRWSVEVHVSFAGNRGTALYFWLIAVD